MLTPLDIDSKTFKRSLFGYSAKDVKVFIHDLLATYEKMYKENIELKDKVNVLNEGIQYYKTIEDTLQSTLLLAEKTAEETKSNAHKKGEHIEKEAELKAQNIMQEARNEMFKINQRKEELTKQFDASKIQIKQFLKAQLELIETNHLDITRDQQMVSITERSMEEAAPTQLEIGHDEEE